MDILAVQAQGRLPSPAAYLPGTHAKLGGGRLGRHQRRSIPAAHQDALVPAMNQPVRKPFAQSGRLLLSARATAAFQS